MFLSENSKFLKVKKLKLPFSVHSRQACLQTFIGAVKSPARPADVETARDESGIEVWKGSRARPLTPLSHDHFVLLLESLGFSR